MKLSIIGLSLVLMASSFASSSKLSTELVQALKTNRGEHEILVFLKGKANLTKVNTRAKSRAEKTARTVETLERFHKQSSRELMSFLSLRDHGQVNDVTSLWVVNGLRMRADARAIEGIAALDSVDSIQLEEAKIFDIERTENGVVLPGTRSEIAWGVKKMRAPDVWEKRGKGDGILVAVVDTGVTTTHADLQPNIFVNPGETGKDEKGNDKATNGIDDDNNGYIDDVNGWNFEQNSKDVVDKYGHGTMVAGIIAGIGTEGTQTGVAPGAKILPIRTLNSFAGFEAKTWEGFQYAMKMKVHVINMSMRVYHSMKPTYAKWRQLGEALLAADIVWVNSAGNEGKGATPHNLGAPPTNPPAWLHEGQKNKGGLSSMISIGAIKEDDTLHSFSSTGPSTWEAVEEYKDYPYDQGKLAGIIKPEVCAPAQVPAPSNSGKGYYQGFSGTSAASPHAAGAVALLLSAEPEYEVVDITEVMMMGSRAFGKAGFGNDCGGGIVDLVTAFEYIDAKKK